MPSIFQMLQDIDEKRIVNLKYFIKASVEVEQSVFPIVNKCLDGIVQAADSIDESKVGAPVNVMIESLLLKIILEAPLEIFWL